MHFMCIVNMYQLLALPQAFVICGLEKYAVVLALGEIRIIEVPNSTIKYNHGSDSVRSLHELKARTTSSCVGGGNVRVKTGQASRLRDRLNREGDFSQRSQTRSS